MDSANNERISLNNKPLKWSHHRWIKIICISFMILTISAASVCLLFKYVILNQKTPSTINIIDEKSGEFKNYFY